MGGGGVRREADPCLAARAAAKTCKGQFQTDYRLTGRSMIGKDAFKTAGMRGKEASVCLQRDFGRLNPLLLRMKDFTQANRNRHPKAPYSLPHASVL